VEWPPKLRQTVKAQISSNGEESLEFVTKEFKLAAVRRLEMGASTAEVARACEIDPNLLHRWRREFREGVETAFPGLGRKRASEENRLAELERKIRQQTLEIDFLKRVLQRVEESRMPQAMKVVEPSTSRSIRDGSWMGRTCRRRQESHEGRRQG
jgi:transposase